MLSSDLLQGWVPRRMASDFSGFKARPLWKNQEVRCMSAVSRQLPRFGELLFDKEMKTLVLSAYSCWSTLNWLMNREMKEVNRIGPRTDPWGTPVLSWVVEETSWPNFTYWTLRDRQDSSHIRALPSTPYIERSRASKIEWSMVSKTAPRSSDMRSVDSPDQPTT